MQQPSRFGIILAILWTFSANAWTDPKLQVAPLNSTKSWCAAIRGNGQSIPAHWGAMASLMDAYGAPSAMSGGSSGSITQFLVESVLMNSAAKNNSQHALLVKSFEAYLEFLSQTPEAQAVRTLLGSADELKKFYQQMMLARATLDHVDPAHVRAYNLAVATFVKKHAKEFKILSEGELKNVLNPDLVQYIGEALEMALVCERMPYTPQAQKLGKQALYRLDQLANGIKMFGKFDAKSDANLFFRPGLISFKNFAVIIGDMANFYAGIDANQGWHKQMGQMLNSCATGTQGLTWKQIVAGRPECQNQFFKLLTTYRTFANVDRSTRLKHKVGQFIPSFVPTSIVTGASAKQYARLKSQYPKQTNPDFGNQFHPKREEIYFANFGSNQDLKTVESKLRSARGFNDIHGNHLNFSQDRKTEMFKALPGYNWHTALMTSPAEPGLSALVEIDDGDLYSSGGWSDLHPVPVLKALGCANVIYVTRKGGESTYAPGIAEKLSILEGFPWDQFNAELNNYGLPEDLDSDWGRLYNLANPKSTFSHSILAADGVWCTDWEASDLLRNGVNDLIMRGHQGKLYLKPEHTSVYLNQSKLTRITQADNLFLADKGYYQYAGCMPFELRP